MTTEKFTAASETFTKNVNDTMKWLQEASATILETQKTQMKSASEVYNKAITAAWGNINKDNFTNAFGVSETMMEVFQKNIETISNLSKTTMKTALDFGKQTDTEKFSKETIAKITETYKAQIEEITAFNKKSFETVSTKFTATNETWWTPTAEKFKKDLDTAVETSKEKLNETISWYNKIATPTPESNKEFFNKLNTQINAGLAENQKLWSEYMNTYATKFSEVKTPADFLKNTWSVNGKKKEEATA